MQESLFNKVAGRPATLLKKRPLHDCFPVNFAKFLRTLFVQNTFKQLLLLERDLVWNGLITGSVSFMSNNTGKIFEISLFVETPTTTFCNI